MKETLGFIGLGIMGKPMVANLVNAGYAVHVHSRSSVDVDQAARAGAIAQACALDVARQADIVITMLPDTPHVREVVLGEAGIIHAMTAGKVVIDMSTISSVATREIADALAQAGAYMLDAPVSGGEKGAIDGTLSIMVGGEAQTFDRCRAIFETLGKRVTHVGGNSAGQVVKSCNQVLAAATVLAMGEALALGTKAGVDPQKIVDVLSNGAARCWALEVRAPEVLRGNFDPGFKSKLQYKDLGLALELSRGIDAPMPLAGIVHEFYKSAIAQGLGEEDHTAVIRIIEQMAAVEIRAQS